MELTIHVDGGARGNPGPAGAGVVIRETGGDLIHEAGYFLGHQTNNVAEYQALIRALERARRAEPQMITVHSDSELLVRQMTGEYKVKSPRLAGLHEQAQMLLLKIPRWSVRHIRRETNTRADELANLAMDRRRNVIVFDVDGDAGGLADEQPGGAAAAPAPEPPAPTRSASEPGQQAVRVTVTRPPHASACPAGGLEQEAFTVTTTLPAGLCIHAAHAILPTLLAMLNTNADEFTSVPTLTVRCGQPDCGAVFQLSPARDPNGVLRDGRA